MPLAHSCASCGCDLSRVAAPLDPVYGLPVVVCPRCGEACARNSQAGRVLPRRWSQAARGGAKILTAVLMLALMSGMAAGACAAASELMLEAETTPWRVLLGAARISQDDEGYQAFKENGGLLALGVLASLGLVAGVYLMVAMPRVKRWKVWAVFFCCAVLWLGAVAGGAMLDSAMRTGWRHPLSQDLSVHRFDLDADDWRGFSGFLASLTVVGLGALMGRPLGRATARSRVGLGVLRWKRKLRRARDRRRRS